MMMRSGCTHLPSLFYFKIMATITRKRTRTNPTTPAARNGDGTIPVTTRGYIDPASGRPAIGSDETAIGKTLAGDGNSWTSFLGRALESGALGGDSIKQLLELLMNNPAVAGTNDDDIAKQLYEMVLKQWTTDEQRKYDQGALQEQRIYDSPTNQLARLMGAGISRDAAIQMLQGGQDPALVGSGSQSTLPEHHSPFETPMQIANTALGFIGAVSGLVGLGLSAPASIAQAKYLTTQNTLLEGQKSAYASAGRAFAIMNAAGSAAECFGSVGAASKEIAKLATSGNKQASAFIADGGLGQMEENAPFAAGVMSQLYRDERGAKDYQKEFAYKMNSMRLQNRLTQASIAETYQNIDLAVGYLRKNDAEIEKIQQDILEGKLRVEIGGVQLDLAKNALKRDNWDLELTEDALFKQTDDQGRNGFQLMSLDKFHRLWEQFELSAAQVSNPDDFRSFLLNNKEIAFNLAVIQASLVRNRVKAGGFDGDSESLTFFQKGIRDLYEFFDLINSSNAGQGFRFLGESAFDLGLDDR